VSRRQYEATQGSMAIEQPGRRGWRATVIGISSPATKWASSAPGPRARCSLLDQKLFTHSAETVSILPCLPAAVVDCGLVAPRARPVPAKAGRRQPSSRRPSSGFGSPTHADLAIKPGLRSGSSRNLLGRRIRSSRGGNREHDRPRQRFRCPEEASS
jgi:hypothetical protein